MSAVKDYYDKLKAEHYKDTWEKQEEAFKEVGQEIEDSLWLAYLDGLLDRLIAWFNSDRLNVKGLVCVISIVIGIFIGRGM